ITILRARATITGHQSLSANTPVLTIQPSGEISATVSLLTSPVARIRYVIIKKPKARVVVSLDVSASCAKTAVNAAKIIPDDPKIAPYKKRSEERRVGKE